jgi:hypothetical protein
MSVVARASFTKLYNERLPYIEEIIFNAYEEHEEQYSQCLNMKTTNRMKEQDLMIADYGLFDRKPEGTDLTMDNIVESYDKEILMFTYAKGIEITKESLRHDQDGVMNERAEGLSFAANQTIEQIAFNEVFNDGFTSAVGADGAAIYGAHTITRGGTWNNSAAVDLDTGGFEDALTHFNDLVDEAGKKIRLRPYALVVGTALEWQARKLLHSGFTPFSNENAINAIQERNVVLKVVNYLSSTTSWFVIAEPRRLKAKFFWNWRPEVESDVDFMSKSGLTSMDFSCGVGVSDPRGLYGSTG